MARTAFHRIFFSSNERTPSGDFWLGVSAVDLRRISADLREGLRVVISEPGELEMEATLHFDAEWNEWVAKGDFATITHLSDPPEEVGDA